MNKILFINLLIIMSLGACNSSDTLDKKKTLTNNKSVSTNTAQANLPHATKLKQLNAKYRPYTIQMPKNWHIKESYKSGGIKASSRFQEKRPNQYPEIAYVNPLKRGRVIYNKDTGGMEQEDAVLEVFFKEHIANLEKTLTNFKLIEQSDVNLNGEPSKRIICEFTNEEEFRLPLRELMYFVAKESEIYTLGGIDSAEDFEEQLPFFEEIIQTFKFTK